jgi:hypothetical protein
MSRRGELERRETLAHTIWDNEMGWGISTKRRHGGKREGDPAPRWRENTVHRKE